MTATLRELFERWRFRLDMWRDQRWTIRDRLAPVRERRQLRRNWKREQRAENWAVRREDFGDLATRRGVRAAVAGTLALLLLTAAVGAALVAVPGSSEKEARLVSNPASTSLGQPAESRQAALERRRARRAAARRRAAAKRRAARRRAAKRRAARARVVAAPPTAAAAPAAATQVEAPSTPPAAAPAPAPRPAPVSPAPAPRPAPRPQPRQPAPVPFSDDR